MKRYHASLQFDQNLHTADQITTEFLGRFWFCIALTIPILIFSVDFQTWFDYTIELPARHYLLFMWSSILFAYGSWLFVIGMIAEWKQRQPGMQTVYAVFSAIGFAYSVSLFYNLLPGAEAFWLMAVLIDGLLLCSYLEM